MRFSIAPAISSMEGPAEATSIDNSSMSLSISCESPEPVNTARRSGDLPCSLSSDGKAVSLETERFNALPSKLSWLSAPRTMPLEQMNPTVIVMHFTSGSRLGLGAGMESGGLQGLIILHPLWKRKLTHSQAMNLLDLNTLPHF